MVLENEQNERFTGKIKFLNWEKNYGFLIKDQDKQDVFFHFRDFDEKSGDLESLKNLENLFSFKEMKYIGKH